MCVVEGRRRLAGEARRAEPITPNQFPRLHYLCILIPINFSFLLTTTTNNMADRVFIYNYFCNAEADNCAGKRLSRRSQRWRRKRQRRRTGLAAVDGQAKTRGHPRSSKVHERANTRQVHRWKRRCVAKSSVVLSVG